jgi:hypothetical protein
MMDYQLVLSAQLLHAAETVVSWEAAVASVVYSVVAFSFPLNVVRIKSSLFPFVLEYFLTGK